MIATLRDSKARLSELVEKASRGEEVLISVRGVPKARLVAITPTKAEEMTKKWTARLRRHQRCYKGTVASSDSTNIVDSLRQERA